MRRVLLFLLLISPILPAATFTVDTTSDLALTVCTVEVVQGPVPDCSLRGAITRANAAAGPDIIEFDIAAISDPGCEAGTGVCTITAATLLPVVSGSGISPILFDGTSQPGWQANTQAPDEGGLDAELKIVLSRGNCPFCLNGLALDEPGSVVRGLVIHGFGNNIVVGSLASGSVVEGCFIGTDATGNAAPLPGDVGILLPGNPSGGAAAGGVRIGGTLPEQRNLISGHVSDGLQLTGFDIQVLGNLIGTNAAGTAALGNRIGVSGEGTGNINNWRYLIGDGTPAGRNLISGNRSDGVQFRNGGTRDTRVWGNYIGTDISGELSLGNGLAGINQGMDAEAPAVDVAVQIGGLLDGQGNRIHFNGMQGVNAGRTRTAIRGNRMGRNAGLGIGLGAATRHANDADDADTGASRRQNFPEISAYATSSGNVDLSYRVDSSVANSAYPLRVEFFKADGDDGRDFLGFDEYTATQAQNVKPINLALPNGVTLTPGDVIVATATDAQGNSSAFSFHSASLSIIDDAPDPSASGTPFEVVVEVAALSGPFTPHGVVQISDGLGGSCDATLGPAATALTATGSCLLSTGAGPRPLTLTAGYNTFRHAFGGATGTSLSATTSHTLAPPPPEQVTFASCVHSVLEDAGTASVRVNRQGGGSVSVAFEHVAGTATAGVDYTAPTAGVLSWTGSDMTPRFIVVPILNDALRETVPETFRLRLVLPVNTAIEPIVLVEVQIYDDENGHLFFNGFEGSGCPQ